MASMRTKQIVLALSVCVVSACEPQGYVPKPDPTRTTTTSTGVTVSGTARAGVSIGG